MNAKLEADLAEVIAKLPPYLVLALKEAFVEARAEEREWCAKLAEKHVSKFNGLQIAQAIRDAK